MARITRKQLKSDKFASEVGHTVQYVGEHRKQVTRYSLAALILLLIAVCLYFYLKKQRTLRQEALSQAIQIQEAPVGPAAPPNAPLSFQTQQAKDTEAIKAFSKIAAAHGGSEEGLIARYYLGAIFADQGKMSEAEKAFKEVADSRDKKYSSLAKLSLGQLYFVEGRPDQGEKLLRSLIDNPTVFVSKEQATIALGRSLEKTKPTDARKLLEPLRTQRTAVSQSAISALSEMQSQ